MNLTDAETCSRSLLGVPVRFSSACAKARERFRLCYGAFPEPVGASGSQPPLAAQLIPVADGYEIRVQGHPPQVGGNLIDAFRAMNHDLLHALMRRNPQYFYLHAGVVEINGGAIVLPGISGAGKSTLVLTLVQSGARFLSDELFVFEPASSLVHPFPRAPKIRDVCLPYFAACSEAFVGDGEGRFLPIDQLSGGVGAVPLPIRGYVFPKYDGSAVTPISAALSGGRMLLELTQSALNFGTHRSQSIDHLADMCDGVSGLQLRWSTPSTAVPVILQAFG